MWLLYQLDVVDKLALYILYKVRIFLGKLGFGTIGIHHYMIALKPLVSNAPNQCRHGATNCATMA